MNAKIQLSLPIALGLGLMLALTACSTKPAAPAQPTERQQMTKLCHDAVLARLKAPATAKFLPEESIDDRAGTWETYLQGSVDAENGFSALIRTTFKCRMSKASGNWEAISVQIPAL